MIPKETPLLDAIAELGNRTPETWRVFSRPNWIRCGDGTMLSVIAGWGCYCQPRPGFVTGLPSDYPGPYTAVEVMLEVTEPPASWENYGQGGCVYCYVPIAVVRAFIQEHGGEDGTDLTRIPAEFRDSWPPA